MPSKSNFRHYTKGSTECKNGGAAGDASWAMATPCTIATFTNLTRATWFDLHTVVMHSNATGVASDKTAGRRERARRP